MNPPGALRSTLESLDDPLALLEGIFAHAPVGLQIYDRNGRCVLVNAAFLELFGSAPPPEYDVREDDIARSTGALDLIQRAFRGETTHTPPLWYDPRELRSVDVREGRRVAMEATFLPLRDGRGEVAHVAVFFKDVTAVMQAREDAARERDLLRAILEQSGDGIIVADDAGVLRLVNDEAARQHGAPLRDLDVAGWAGTCGLERESGEPLASDETALARALEGERVTGARWAVRRPDGTRRLLTGTATPLLGPGGARGAVLVTRDETERLEAEEARDRTVRFREQFVGILGHDLRSPLTAILASVEQVLRQGPPAAPGDWDRAERSLGRVRSCALRMGRMIHDLLDFTRTRLGPGLPVERRPVDLAHVCRAVLEELAQVHPDRAVSLSTQGELGGRWDADRLTQLTSNLVGNAISYGRPGTPVRVSAAGRGDDVVLEVHNEGAPIPPEDLPTLFEPFHRTHATRGERGLGLGLFIVRSIVESHGGRIEVHSSAERGTTFTVRLPRREPSAGPPALPYP